MSLNKPKSFLPVQANNIKPQSVAAAGTAVSGWIDCSEAHTIAALLLAGALGGGSVAITWQQGDTNAGGNAKECFAASGAITTNDTEGWYEYAVDSLDINAGFRWVQATATVTGGTGSLLALGIFAAKN